MPIKDPEKRKQYHRKYMKKRREREKAKKQKEREAEITEQLRLGNLNYGLPIPKFPTYKQWKKENPDGTFRDYLEAKEQHRARYTIPKVEESEEADFPIGGVNLWSDEDG